jgi:hypothetical protein
MFKLLDIVIEVQITGVDPIPNSVYHEAGSLLVTYNNGPQSRFAIRPSVLSKELLGKAVMSVARGKVLDAIEAAQQLKDGEPVWLIAAKAATDEPRYLRYM